jgi:hypothetical protein
MGLSPQQGVAVAILLAANPPLPPPQTPTVSPLRRDAMPTTYYTATHEQPPQRALGCAHRGEPAPTPPRLRRPGRQPLAPPPGRRSRRRTGRKPAAATLQAESTDTAIAAALEPSVTALLTVDAATPDPVAAAATRPPAPHRPDAQPRCAHTPTGSYAAMTYRHADAERGRYPNRTAAAHAHLHAGTYAGRAHRQPTSTPTEPLPTAV